MQLQTFDKAWTSDQLDDIKRMVTHAVQTADPEAVLFYAGDPGMNLWDDLHLSVPTIKVEARIKALAAQAKGRSRRFEH